MPPSGREESLWNSIARCVPAARGDRRRHAVGMDGIDAAIGAEAGYWIGVADTAGSRSAAASPGSLDIGRSRYSAVAIWARGAPAPRRRARGLRAGRARQGSTETRSRWRGVPWSMRRSCFPGFTKDEITLAWNPRCLCPERPLKNARPVMRASPLRSADRGDLEAILTGLLEDRYSVTAGRSAFGWWTAVTVPAAPGPRRSIRGPPTSASPGSAGVRQSPVVRPLAVRGTALVCGGVMIHAGLRDRPYHGVMNGS